MNDLNLTKTPIQKACDILGGRVSLAAQLQVTPQAVHKWVKNNKTPILRSVQIEYLTRKRITKEELRPDIFWGNDATPP